MAHAQNPDFVFRRNGQVHLNRRGRQFSRLLAAELCASAVVMLDTPRSEIVRRVLATHSIRQFPLHFPHPCVTVCHHISNGACHTPLQPTTRNSPIGWHHKTETFHPQPSSLAKLRIGATSFLLDSWTLRMGPVGYPETSVRNYQYSLHNDSEKSSSKIALDS